MKRSKDPTTLAACPTGTVAALHEPVVLFGYILAAGTLVEVTNPDFSGAALVRCCFEVSWVHGGPYAVPGGTACEVVAASVRAMEARS